MSKALAQVAARGVGLAKLSTHPLELYSTWIPVDHLGTLIDEMTLSAPARGSWARPLPTAVQVGLCDQTLRDYGVLARNRIIGAKSELLPLVPGQADLIEKRRPTQSIMGDSANQVRRPCRVVCHDAESF